MSKYWRTRILSILLLILVGLLPMHVLAAASWHTVSAETFSLLWKDLTYTQLQVDPQQALPLSGDILTPDYAKQIIIEYKVGVSAARFRKMTQTALTDAYSAEELAGATADIAHFCDWYKSVEKGGQYRLTWRPELGLRLYFNDEYLGEIRDPNAAALILSVWLGRAAVSESQRDIMLAAWRQSLMAPQGENL